VLGFARIVGQLVGVIKDFSKWLMEIAIVRWIQNILCGAFMVLFD
jgi:hypothetical protein